MTIARSAVEFAALAAGGGQAAQGAASLDPEDARHSVRAAGEDYAGQGDEGWVAKAPGNALVIEQIDRPPAVRRATELHVPCECGRPIVGLEIELLRDAEGWSLYTHGICLKCGRQEAYYVSPPKEVAPQEKEAALRAEVEELLREITRLRLTPGGSAAA